MLQRTTLTPPMSQPESLAPGQVSPAYAASWLRHYLVLIVLISVVACALIWQATDTRSIKVDTYYLGRQAAELERENSRLMAELAALDSPANIEREATRLGISVEKAPSIVVTPVQLMTAPEAQENRYAAIPKMITSWAIALIQRDETAMTGQDDSR